MRKSVIALLHTGYWILYLLLVSSFVLIIPHEQKTLSWAMLGRILFFSPISFFVILPGIIGFYTFYLCLFPRYLNRKRLMALALYGIAAGFACASVLLCLSSLLDIVKAEKSGEWDARIPELVFLSFLVLIHGIIGLVMRGFVTWYAEIKLKEDLNKKHYETELALVKSRLNPHFLFNTINNIDVLIQKDGERASAYLNKLSSIMRFMLYETKAEKIPLTRELACIEEYIDLQKIRTSNADYVQYSREGDAEQVLIPPMLFIPFIENAFKYASPAQAGHAIRIRISITKEQLRFFCENKCCEEPQTNQQGGLGYELIQKRLLLLYGDRHQLETVNRNGIYQVTLLLDHHANELYHH